MSHKRWRSWVKSVTLTLVFQQKDSEYETLKAAALKLASDLGLKEYGYPADPLTGTAEQHYLRFTVERQHRDHPDFTRLYELAVDRKYTLDQPPKNARGGLLYGQSPIY